MLKGVNIYPPACMLFGLCLSLSLHSFDELSSEDYSSTRFIFSVLFGHPFLGRFHPIWVEVPTLHLLSICSFMNQVLTNFVAKQIHLEIGISTMCF
jgi:hypothetical protein